MADKKGTKITSPNYNLVRILIFSLVEITIIFVSLIFGMKLQIKLGNPPLIPIQNSEICPKNSHDIPKGEFLRTYTVQAGDSLLKIAVNELGDQNRINEIIYPNLNKFPATVNPSPLLEVGWNLYLPPRTFPPSSGYFRGLQGKVWEVTDSNILLTFDPDTNRLYGDRFYAHYESDINFVPEVGDCVTIIMDTTNLNGREPRVIKITRQ